MSELNHTNNSLFFDVSEAISVISHSEFKDSESIWCLELGWVLARICGRVVKVDSVMRIKLNEFQLNVISQEGSESTIGLFLMNVNVVIQFVKNSVVFRSNSFPLCSSLQIYSSEHRSYLVMSDIRDLDDSSLLEGPLEELLTELIVSTSLNSPLVTETR